MQHAKLWKRILNEGVFHGPESHEALAPLVGSVIRSTIIVDSRLQIAAEEWGRPWRWDTFTDLVFPFEQFWIEGYIDDGSMWGALVAKRPSEEVAGIHAIISQPNQAVLYIGRTDLMCPPDGSARPRPANQGGAEVFLEGNSDFIANFVDPATRYNGLITSVCTVMDNVCDALQMLGVKNIGLRSNAGDPKQVRRAVKRHGGSADDYRYHTMIVRSLGAKADSPGVDIGIMPRHVVRGHCHEYGPKYGKGLLFGKYEGKFYITPHTRGNKENGVVEKDYIIKA